MLVDEILSGVNMKQSPISNHVVEQLRNAGKFAIWEAEGQPNMRLVFCRSKILNQV